LRGSGDGVERGGQDVAVIVVGDDEGGHGGAGFKVR
jgi:hypothetical protein